MQWVRQPSSKVLGYVGYRLGDVSDVGRLLLLKSGVTVLQTPPGAIRTVAAGSVPASCIVDETGAGVGLDDEAAGLGTSVDYAAKLVEARTALGLSTEGFARLMQVQSGRTVRKWEAGERDVPGPVIVLTDAIMCSAEVRRHFGLAIKGDQAE